MLKPYQPRSTMPPLFSLGDLQAAAQLVYAQMPPTPQYNWPALSARLGMPVWVKHENHTPTGAFKIRGGITLIDWLRRTHPDCPGVITATRGNHGQSIARAASMAGLRAKIYVPFGNSREKNAAMRAFGAELVEFGKDFDEARLEAMRIAEADGLYLIPPFHPELVRGVASYGLELFDHMARRNKRLDTVYVPVGCGSGICALITVRDLLGLDTKIVGVVSDQATAVMTAFETGKPTTTPTAATFADGVATRVVFQEPLDIFAQGAARIIAVSDAEIANAIRIYYHDTHNTAEGAGAISLAGLIKEQNLYNDENIGVILCGSNIDTDKFIKVLEGGIPAL